MGGNSLRRTLAAPTAPAWLSRLGPLFALAMQGALWATAIGAALASTTYTWPVEPFSVIGAGGGAVATAFNAGLVASGLLALPAAAWLWATLRPAIGALYGLTGLAFVLGGLFPIPSPLHEAAAGIFVFVWLLCWVAGITYWRADGRRRAVTHLALGAAAVVVWLPYDFGLEWAKVGYGGAETVAFGVLTAWTLLAVRRGADEK